MSVSWFSFVFVVTAQTDVGIIARKTEIKSDTEAIVKASLSPAAMLTLSLSPKAAEQVASGSVPAEIISPPKPPPAPKVAKTPRSFLTSIVYRIFGIGVPKSAGEKPPATPTVVGYGSTFKVVPHLDQNAVYSAVHQRLFDGGSVGIFPEGGSHDQPELLPLKAGVIIMALGAMAEKPDLDVKLVPVGLHYFNRYACDSTIFVECFQDTHLFSALHVAIGSVPALPWNTASRSTFPAST